MKSKFFLLFIISLISLLILSACGTISNLSSESDIEAQIFINDKNQPIAHEQIIDEEQPINEEQTETVIEGIFEFTLINDDSAYSISKFMGSNEEVVVPSSYNDLPVVQIGYYSFANIKELKNITLPESIIDIGEMAFSNSGLISITIPMNVSDIGMLAFANCDNIKEINVDSRNKYYKSIYGVLFNFSGTDLYQYPIGNARTSYVVPSGVLNIKMSAFESSNILESITLPDSLLGLEQNSLSNCNRITEIFIPKNVNNISLTLQDCKRLENINVCEDNMHYKSVNGVLFDKDLTCIFIYPSGKKASGYIIPDTVTRVGSAFFNVHSLELLIIPESVTILHSGAIYQCMNLKTVIILCSNPPILSPETFKFFNDSIAKHFILPDLAIYIPAQSLELYKSAEYWSDLSDIFLAFE